MKEGVDLKSMVFALLAFCGASCGDRNVQFQPDPPLHDIYFNQILLRDAVGWLDSLSKVSVALSPEVNGMRDLWVNYIPDPDGEPIEVVIGGILEFIRETHQIDLAFTRSPEGILIDLRN